MNISLANSRQSLTRFVATDAEANFMKLGNVLFAALSYPIFYFFPEHHRLTCTVPLSFFIAAVMVIRLQRVQEWRHFHSLADPVVLRIVW